MAKLSTVLGTYHLRLQTPDILHGFRVVLGIFNQNIHNHIVLAMFCGEISGLLIITALAAHSDGRLEIKLELPRGLDERVQLASIFKFCITVQEQCCVIDCRPPVIMQLFQILNQVMNSLGVEIL